jgi:hypothetical protein
MATAVGIVVAGVWTYLVFVRQRQKFPRAALVMSISDSRLPDGRVLLRVAAELRNIGSTMIRVEQVEAIVQRVAPLQADVWVRHAAEYQATNSAAACEIPWLLVAHRRQKYASGSFEVEPGESDTCHYDFILNRRTVTTKVTVHVVNRQKRTRSGSVSLRDRPTTIGWKAVTYYDVVSVPTPKTAKSDTSRDNK